MVEIPIKYKQMCAIAMNELNAPTPDIGYFGGGRNRVLTAKTEKQRYDLR